MITFFFCLHTIHACAHTHTQTHVIVPAHVPIVYPPILCAACCTHHTMPHCYGFKEELKQVQLIIIQQAQAIPPPDTIINTPHQSPVKYVT